MRLHPLALSVCLSGLVIAGPWTAAPDAAAPSYDRLRPQSDTVRRWLARGIAESATFRDLVARIERSDVIVYLETQRTMRPGVTACLTWMATAPTTRLVRASLRLGLSGHDAVATLAHELQHVVEVIDHPEVTSQEQLAALYTRIGHPSTTAERSWDTTAARSIGVRVRRELLG